VQLGAARRDARFALLPVRGDMRHGYGANPGKLMG